MALMFIAVAAAGLALVLYEPTQKNRKLRFATQTASTMLLAVGLFGGLFQLMTV